MSQETKLQQDEDLLPEYDFSQGVRGKHHELYKAGTNVVFLEPDLAMIFKDSDSVNQALLLLLTLSKDGAAPNKPV